MLEADSVLCHVGGEETMDAFNQNLRGANTGEHKNFDVTYPADYPEFQASRKTYSYSSKSWASRKKSGPT